jgi:cation diffusion facilitator CzcD-associated flavoprotein CzcO
LDYQTLKGKRVGVIGAGASAMDSAATALECGAQSVDMLIRRADLPRINKGKGAGNPGLTNGHVDLPDEWKWRIRHYINTQQVPPPRGSTLRVSKYANARFNLGCSIDEIKVNPDGTLAIHTPKGIFELDFLIFATGFKIDWLARPEYAVIAKHLRTWGDRYQQEAGLEDRELQDSPDLGASFDLREKNPGQCPGLERIHVFCYPAALSHGTVSGDIPAISDGAKRLAQGIVSLFYKEDIAEHFENIKNFAEPEIMGDEWSTALPPQILKNTH